MLLLRGTPVGIGHLRAPASGATVCQRSVILALPIPFPDRASAGCYFFS